MHRGGRSSVVHWSRVGFGYSSNPRRFRSAHPPWLILPCHCPACHRLPGKKWSPGSTAAVCPPPAVCCCCVRSNGGSRLQVFAASKNFLKRRTLPPLGSALKRAKVLASRAPT